MKLPDLTTLRTRMDERDQAREAVIKRSRTILKNAKHAIVLGHEDRLEEADKSLAAAREEKEALEQAYAGVNDPAGIGAFQQALEEYAEATLFLASKREGALPSAEALGVSAEEYLGALSDLTGELSRTAVFAATERDKEKVEEIWRLVKSIQAELAQFTLRGSLRKKYDAIKYNLQRIEQARYDLAIRS